MTAVSLSLSLPQIYRFSSHSAIAWPFPSKLVSLSSDCIKHSFKHFSMTSLMSTINRSSHILLFWLFHSVCSIKRSLCTWDTHIPFYYPSRCHTCPMLLSSPVYPQFLSRHYCALWTLLFPLITHQDTLSIISKLLEHCHTYPMLSSSYDILHSFLSFHLSFPLQLPLWYYCVLHHFDSILNSPTDQMKANGFTITMLWTLGWFKRYLAVFCSFHCAIALGSPSYVPYPLTICDASQHSFCFDSTLSLHIYFSKQ